MYISLWEQISPRKWKNQNGLIVRSRPTENFFNRIVSELA